MVQLAERVRRLARVSSLSLPRARLDIGEGFSCWYIRKRPEAVRYDDPLFASLRKRRLRRSTAYHTFRDLLRECGLRPGKAPTGPRIHDLRHTFAVTRLLQWYKSGENLHALLPALATYMGHSDVMHTQVCLSATAELLGQASERFLAHFRSPVVDKGQNHE